MFEIRTIRKSLPRWRAALAMVAMLTVVTGSDLTSAQESAQTQKPVEDFKPAVLKVVTNFAKADVTVNGMQYPEYVENTDKEGMVLPAGGPYTVKVTYDGKTKTYQIALAPYKVRILMVELTGFKGGNVQPGSQPNPSPRSKADADEKENGQVTVYSRPKGQILIDGDARGSGTPGTVQVEPGRHDIQIRYENGEMSETKTVRVRKGQRLKLFFRSE